MFYTPPPSDVDGDCYLQSFDFEQAELNLGESFFGDLWFHRVYTINTNREKCLNFLVNLT